MMNGDLDPQTPLMWALEASTHWKSQNQQIVVIPFSPHATVFQAHVSNAPTTCGIELMVSLYYWGFCCHLVADDL
jgi:hypothetical protein